MKKLVRLVVAVALLCCCGGAWAETTQAVSIYVVKSLLASPNFVALANGYWAGQGLDVRMQLAASGSTVLEALHAGDAQLGDVALSAALPIARADGDNLIVVLPYYNDPAYMARAGAYAIVGRKDHGIDAADPASLLGKKIGFTVGTDEYYVRQWFLRQKLDIANTELVAVPVEEMSAMLAQGQINAVVLWEPYASQVIRELGPNAAVVSRGDAGLISDNVGIVGTADWVRNNPDVVEKFATGIAMATKFIRENPHDAAEIMTRTFDGINLADAAEGLQHMTWDPRISICTIEASIRSGNDMARNGQIKMDRDFVAADFYDLMVYVRVASKHPELFEGLPPVPARAEDCQGKLDG